MSKHIKALEQCIQTCTTMAECRSADTQTHMEACNRIIKACENCIDECRKHMDHCDDLGCQGACERCIEKCEETIQITDECYEYLQTGDAELAGACKECTRASETCIESCKEAIDNSCC